MKALLLIIGIAHAFPSHQRPSYYFNPGVFRAPQNEPTYPIVKRQSNGYGGATDYEAPAAPSTSTGSGAQQPVAPPSASAYSSPVGNNGGSSGSFVGSNAAFNSAGSGAGSGSFTSSGGNGGFSGGSTTTSDGSGAGNRYDFGSNGSGAGGGGAQYTSGFSSAGDASGTGNRYDSGNSGGSSSSSSGSGSSVKCSRIAGSSGDTYRFQCQVVRKEDLVLKYTHVLWLANKGSNAPPVEVIVPNYSVEEVIKAGFKGTQSNSKQAINILLQRPEKTVAAEVDVPTSGKIEPEVNIQYQPAENKLIHYPNDQQYRPLSGPILPPPRN